MSLALKEDWQDHQMTAQGHDRHTLIVGLGATGLATANYLASRGERVRVIDSRAEPPGLRALGERWPAIPVELGTLDFRWLEGITRVVLSPGLACDIPLAVEARRRGLPVVSDIELFARAAEAPVLAVTGSNGKSTVITLLERMLEAGGLRAVAGGNLGPPALDLLADPGCDAYLLEVSSFQLETTESLEPLAAAVLNVSPDHLDRHETLDRYAALKARLLSASQTAIVNWDDVLVRRMALTHPNYVAYSLREPLARGYGVLDHEGCRWLARDREPLLRVSALKLRGAHNEANALAALALAECAARDLESRRSHLEALRAFPGLPHRCQWVAKHSGVDFINDSKATNVGATVAALNGLPGPLVLIAGGLSKNGGLSPLVEAGKGKLKGAVLIGSSQADLKAALDHVCPVQLAEGMADAVERARAMAATGDTVLLSPACASQDMFDDYRARGDAFIAAVRGTSL